MSIVGDQFVTIIHIQTVDHCPQSLFMFLSMKQGLATQVSWYFSLPFRTYSQRVLSTVDGYSSSDPARVRIRKLLVNTQKRQNSEFLCFIGV